MPLSSLSFSISSKEEGRKDNSGDSASVTRVTRVTRMKDASRGNRICEDLVAALAAAKYRFTQSLL